MAATTKTKPKSTKTDTKKKKKKTAKDGRPPVAIGHVQLETHAVPETIEFFKSLGLRQIFRNERFGVLELRGGTHLVVSSRERPIRKGTKAPFDIMVDDVKKARKAYHNKGFEPTEIEEGSIHSSFFIKVPSGHKLKINSSHAGKRTV